jgi:signal transduction histidine kinase
VQEALTNVLRHAGPAHCAVDVRCGDGALQLRITDDGHAAATAIGLPPTAGHGLVGMRERVALFEGDLVAAPVPGGGFAVHATLPLRAPASRA